MKLFFALLFISSPLLASGQIYKILGQAVIMMNNNGVIANRDCFKSPSLCQALTQAKKFQGKFPQSSGKNPYAEKCKELLRGKVIVGTDQAGNENSFCMFDDHTFISCSSLH